MKRCDALMAVMRKMLIVSYHLVKTKQDDDPTKHESSRNFPLGLRRGFIP
jgi:hypothetical protein